MGVEVGGISTLFSVYSAFVLAPLLNIAASAGHANSFLCSAFKTTSFFFSASRYLEVPLSLYPFLIISLSPFIECYVYFVKRIKSFNLVLSVGIVIEVCYLV